MSVQQYFKILGISPTKDIKIIKAAFRKKAFQYHPDKNHSPGAKLKFIQINEAYEQLLLAIGQAEKQGIPLEETETQQKSYSAPAPSQKSRHQREQEERFQRAKAHYQYMKRKEAEENERYFQAITNGKRWLIFKAIVISCSLISCLLILDNLIFETSFTEAYVIKDNSQLVYSNIGGDDTTPVILNDGKKLWIPLRVITFDKPEVLYVEYTAIFNDIKSVNIWIENKWTRITPDYSIMKTFPLIPLILLLPLATFVRRSRSYSFITFYNISFYFIPFVLFTVLYSNDRWLHLLMWAWQ